MSSLIKAIKALVLLAILAPATLWLDQNFGPGYTKSMQQQMLADLKSPASDKTSDTQPIDKTNDELAENTDTKTTTAAKTTAATKPAQLQGIDISHFQGDVNWQVLAKDNLDFVFVKATGGETYVDPKFSSNWHALRTVNITRGAYHFFYASDDGKRQAEHFLKTVGHLKPTDLPPVLDVEITDHSDAQTILTGVLAWLETIESEIGRLPIIYSDVSFAKQYLNDEKLSKYPLWIADYNKTLAPLPSAWQQNGWAFWQYSQSGHVLGINGNVDKDVFNGDNDAFATFIQSTVIK